MTPYWTNGRVVLWQGHVLDALAAMEAGSCHMVATSPPYYGLRSYGLPPVEWPAVSYAQIPGSPSLDIPGCDPGCVHVWGEERIITNSAPRDHNGAYAWGDTRGQERQRSGTELKASQGQYCQLCGGWRGCLGLEPTPEMFVGHIVLVARELWRVLRDDGTFWLNFGDSYFGDSPTRKRSKEAFSKEWDKSQTASRGGLRRSASQQNGLKPKNLIGIPWRVAFALQADGWYLRSDIIWAKGVSFCPTYSGSCMPESVRDRPTKGHEYVFLLSKNKRYFYDGDAVREPHTTPAGMGWAGNGKGTQYSTSDYGQHKGTADFSRKGEGLQALGGHSAGRNLRTVWTINPGNFPGSHFATFPVKLVEPMIKAGTSAKGCCPECGSPWVRVTSKEFIPQQDVSREKGVRGNGDQKPLDKTDGREGYPRGTTAVTTTGWTPTCSHYDALYYSDFAKPKDPRKWAQRAMSGNWFKRARKRPGLPGWPVDPCTVLDPFFGSGTTGQVALKLGRRAVGVELSQKYCDEHIIPRLSKGIQMEMTL